MDTFHTGATLQDLSSRPLRPSKSVLAQLKKVEDKEPQIISGRWIDKDGVTLAVYFTYSKDEKPDAEGGKNRGHVVPNQGGANATSKVL
jgi:hypothetical protein